MNVPPRAFEIADPFRNLVRIKQTQEVVVESPLACVVDLCLPARPLRMVPCRPRGNRPWRSGSRCSPRSAVSPMTSTRVVQRELHATRGVRRRVSSDALPGCREDGGRPSAVASGRAEAGDLALDDRRREVMDRAPTGCRPSRGRCNPRRRWRRRRRPALAGTPVASVGHRPDGPSRAKGSDRCTARSRTQPDATRRQRTGAAGLTRKGWVPQAARTDGQTPSDPLCGKGLRDREPAHYRDPEQLGI